MKQAISSPYLLNHSNKYEWKWMISYRKIWNSFLFQLLTVWRLRGKIIKVKSKLFWAEKHKNLWQWREDNFIKKIIEFFNKGRRKSIEKIKGLLNIPQPSKWSRLCQMFWFLTFVWMQSIGLPTYCLVVTMTENVNRITEEMHLL